MIYRALLVIGPRSDFSPEEIASLRRYWNAQGRLLMLLNPRVKTPVIDQFLQGLGLRARRLLHAPHATVSCRHSCATRSAQVTRVATGSITG